MSLLYLLYRFSIFSVQLWESTFGGMTSKVLENIKAERKRQEITQQDMADRMELSLSAYGKFERGETQTTQDKVEKAASILGKDISCMFLGYRPSSSGDRSLEENKENRYLSELESLRKENEELRRTVEAKDELIASLKHTVSVLEQIRTMYEKGLPKND